MTELCWVTWKHYLKRLAWYRTMQCSPKALFKWRATSLTVVGCYWKEMHTKCPRFHFQKCSDWRNSTFRIYRKRPKPCQLATAPPSARKQPIKLHHRWTLGVPVTSVRVENRRQTNCLMYWFLFKHNYYKNNNIVLNYPPPLPPLLPSNLFYFTYIIFYFVSLFRYLCPLLLLLSVVCSFFLFFSFSGCLVVGGEELGV